jgi:hypothetical protein
MPQSAPQEHPLGEEASLHIFYYSNIFCSKLEKKPLVIPMPKAGASLSFSRQKYSSWSLPSRTFISTTKNQKRGSPTVSGRINELFPVMFHRQQ